MTSTEDAIADVLIKRYNGGAYEDPRIYPEEHYNYYGDRGVVDIYIESADQRFLHEVKSEQAVRGVTGANAILRQFNRMRRYFFDGSPHNLPTGRRGPAGGVEFVLNFEPTPYTYQHLIDNGDMYVQAVTNHLIEVPSKVHVTCRVSLTPTDSEGGSDVLMYARRSNNKIFDVRTPRGRSTEKHLQWSNDRIRQRVLSGSE